MTAFDPWIQIIGSQNIITGSDNKFQIAVGNNGNGRAVGILFSISIPKSAIASIDNPRIFIDSLLAVDSIMNYSLSINDFVETYSEIDNDSILSALCLIPVLQPGEIFYLDKNIQFSVIGDCNISTSILNSTLFDESLSSASISPVYAISFCDEFPDCVKSLLDYWSEYPVGDCMEAFVKLEICGFMNYYISFIDAINDPTWKNYLNVEYYFVLWQAAHLSLIAECTLVEGRDLLSLPYKILNGDINSKFKKMLNDCMKDPLKRDSYTIQVISSIDPNLKTGPAGFGSQKFINRNSELFYNIYFENSDSATAPANLVAITDQIDTAHSDLKSFRFTGFMIGDSTFAFNIESNSFVHDYDLRPNRNSILRTDFKFNDSTGLATWQFTSLDPVTLGTLPDPLDGFLPPNVNGNEGQASVTYHIKPKQGLPNQTVISNEASIVFDYNDPIITPAWINTIDVQSPQSNVLLLPAIINDTSFTVHWSGADTDAGIRNYKIYVSDNDSAFYLWLINMEIDSAVFKGQFGHKYEFFSIARDSVGNMEVFPVNPEQYPDAVTNLAIPVPHPYFLDLDNDGYGSFTNRMLAMFQPNGFVSDSTDCNDTMPLMHPGATEICYNGLDDNCNGEIDEFCGGAVLNIRLFFEGYYSQSNKLIPVLQNAGAYNNEFLCDLIVVELHDEFNPDSVFASQKSILDINGNAKVNFPSAIMGGNYYIVIKHHSSIETWSKQPVLFSSITNFDFTTN